MVNIFNAQKPRDFASPVPADVVAPMVLRVKRADGEILTPSQSIDARYLNCEITFLDGPYKGAKAFPRLVVEGSSEGAKTAADISFGLIGSIARSAMGVRADDLSPEVEAKLVDFDFEDLDGVAFIGKTGKIERGRLRDPSAGPNSDRYDDKTTIARGVTPDMEKEWKMWPTAPRGLGRAGILNSGKAPSGSPTAGTGGASPPIEEPPWAKDDE
jgi:hypothetical protein